MNRKIWCSETDKYSAESRAEATRLRDADYGWDPEGDDAQGDQFEDMPLDDDSNVGVMFQDGAENGRAYPAWVDVEPEASLEWFGEGNWRYAKVSAPARVWAKNETGMIASTEF